MNKKIITGLTMGEPAGISSEITLKIWKNYRKKIDPFIYFGDPEHLLNTSKILKLKIPLKVINKVEDAHKIFNNFLPIYKIKLTKKVKLGKPSIKNSNKVLKSIIETVKFANKKELSSIVTNPVEKNVIKKKNKSFDGHTFYISKLLNIKNPVMLLSSPKINVIPLTQHLSLKNAIKSLNKNIIISTTKTTNKYFKNYFNKNRPKIEIASLNPHAGENGIFGNQ